MRERSYCDRGTNEINISFRPAVGNLTIRRRFTTSTPSRTKRNNKLRNFIGAEVGFCKLILQLIKQFDYKKIFLLVIETIQMLDN